MIDLNRPAHAVVVAYHAPDALESCLAGLERALEVTVVDNSSSSSVRAVAHGRGATYIDPETNVGFAAGVNLALRKLMVGPPADVLLLNPDAILAPSDLRMLLGFLHRAGNERVAAASPRLVGDDGVEQRVVWPLPTPGRAWFEAAGFAQLPARRTFVVGAAIALRWEALREIGLFDERFFLYAEEVDWQRRGLDLGWSARLCSDAVAVHSGAGTSTDPLRREMLFHAAHETYIRKWHGPAGWLIYRSAACLGASVRALVRVGERRAEAARRARLYFRGPVRCAALSSD